MSIAAIVRPELTEAEIPNGKGVLDELNTSPSKLSNENMTMQPELADSRGRHSRHRSRHPGYRQRNYWPRRRHAITAIGGNAVIPPRMGIYVRLSVVTIRNRMAYRSPPNRSHV